MKNKKGFTLIELLAVIVILAIIALIAVPVILNILDKSNESAFKDTAYGIISAGELYFAEQELELNGMLEDKVFTLPSVELDIKGQVPEGKMIVNTEGKVALMVKNGRYCVTKGFNDMGITLTEDVERCYVPNTLAALSVEDVACATDMTEGACAPGTIFTINVNDNESKNFYVIDDEGDKVTLIMSENLGNTVAWIDATDYTTENNKDETPNACSYTSCNDEGPITAINYLDGLTDDEWSNVLKKDYTYSGIGDDGTTKIYNDITRTMRARMLTYGEANAIKTANNGIGYWTSTAHASGSNRAWDVSGSGSVSNYYVDHASSFGVRPVIELSK